MKISLVQSSQLDVFQRQRVRRIGRNDNILPDLRSMGKNARKTVENAHAELDYVVAPRARASATKRS